ncbi:cyclic pyranopterin monophosphate synthase MoaC [Pseudoalteromonas sp. KG3]|jgi:cyclic pyranopterin phosphate synthase|uniref:cyclic pyranopterin monophosphate synthase MoaC n=1 Tax=Pseudoalteromonas TaxID=53246 RepID=UPI002147B71D|nr:MULTISPECIES: cyclic pyranopterin monophosphate synthase MoaC [Pseudoalteromonas]WKD25527.1 cyclic pyranopterin monophosphate synthase MoaC [Pseudoalteromonas sp. KG3]
MLTHVDQHGKASMIDVSDKPASCRQAVANASITMSTAAFELLKNNEHKKGDVLQVARIAGIQAAKKCADLIPLCHPLMLSKVAIDFSLDEQACRVDITALAKLTGQTGVEMEALTAASIAALTIFDMCKAVDSRMHIGNIQVIEKQGGKSGHFINTDH